MEEVKEKSFEEALQELETIVKELESGNADLDKTINKYSDAMRLVKYCSDKLKNAEEKAISVFIRVLKLHIL